MKQNEFSFFIESLSSLLAEETDSVANMANAASFLYHNLEQINWAGFYILKEDDLVVGPFCGKPACTRIAPGRGVCGTALLQNRILVVPDVSLFPGHIACDADSRSELVIPLSETKNLNPFAVLDIDSSVLNRFDPETVSLLTEASVIITKSLFRKK